MLYCNKNIQDVQIQKYLENHVMFPLGLSLALAAWAGQGPGWGSTGCLAPLVRTVPMEMQHPAGSQKSLTPGAFPNTASPKRASVPVPDFCSSSPAFPASQTRAGCFQLPCPVAERPTQPPLPASRVTPAALPRRREERGFGGGRSTGPAHKTQTPVASQGADSWP